MSTRQQERIFQMENRIAELMSEVAHLEGTLDAAKETEERLERRLLEATARMYFYADQVPQSGWAMASPIEQDAWREKAREAWKHWGDLELKAKGDTTMTHTPGPWTTEVNSSGELLVHCGDAHEIFLGDMEYTCGECHANARLIAAAPELLEAGQLVIDCWEQGDLAEAVNLLDKAIRKAKGE